MPFHSTLFFSLVGLFFFFKILCIDFRKRGREEERRREISMPLARAATLARSPGNLLIGRTALNQRSHAGLGSSSQSVGVCVFPLVAEGSILWKLY